MAYCETGFRVPGQGAMRASACEPSEPSSNERTPHGASVACNTTAPAPSPNSTHVVRSVMSRFFEITSAPTTRIVL